MIKTRYWRELCVLIDIKFLQFIIVLTPKSLTLWGRFILFMTTTGALFLKEKIK